MLRSRWNSILPFVERWRRVRNNEYLFENFEWLARYSTWWKDIPRPPHDSNYDPQQFAGTEFKVSGRIVQLNRSIHFGAFLRPRDSDGLSRRHRRRSPPAPRRRLSRFRRHKVVTSLRSVSLTHSRRARSSSISIQPRSRPAARSKRTNLPTPSISIKRSAPP